MLGCEGYYIRWAKYSKYEVFKHKKVTDTSTNGKIQGKVAKYSKKVTNSNKKWCKSTLDRVQQYVRVLAAPV